LTNTIHEGLVKILIKGIIENPILNNKDTKSRGMKNYKDIETPNSLL